MQTNTKDIIITGGEDVGRSMLQKLAIDEQMINLDGWNFFRTPAPKLVGKNAKAKAKAKRQAQKQARKRNRK